MGPPLKDKDDSLDKLDVEELTLEDLKRKDEDRKQDRGKPGGLRAGGLGPEGSRYTPPGGPRKRTWKPLLAAGMLFVAAFLGLYLIGRTDVAVFDGSWTEWAGHPDAPIEP